MTESFNKIKIKHLHVFLFLKSKLSLVAVRTKRKEATQSLNRCDQDLEDFLPRKQVFCLFTRFCRFSACRKKFLEPKSLLDPFGCALSLYFLQQRHALVVLRRFRLILVRTLPEVPLTRFQPNAASDLLLVVQLVEVKR